MNINLFLRDIRRPCNYIIRYHSNFIQCVCAFSSSNKKTNFYVSTSKQNATKYRYYGTSTPSNFKIPPLMSFPEIVWPSLIKSIQNFILATFIIRPYFDKEFNLPDFVKGAKQALEVISTKLSGGDYKSLNGYVTNDIIPKLNSSVALMSLAQREFLAINKDDVYFTFPYQVGVIFNDEDGREQKRYVEITMVFHSLKGLAAMRERGEEPPLNMGMLPEYQQRISICNYRFIREYTKGVEGEWSVNLLNHFRPSDSEDN